MKKKQSLVINEILMDEVPDGSQVLESYIGGVYSEIKAEKDQ